MISEKFNVKDRASEVIVFKANILNTLFETMSGRPHRVFQKFYHRGHHSGCYVVESEEYAERLQQEAREYMKWAESVGATKAYQQLFENVGGRFFAEAYFDVNDFRMSKDYFDSPKPSLSRFCILNNKLALAELCKDYLRFLNKLKIDGDVVKILDIYLIEKDLVKVSRGFMVKGAVSKVSHYRGLASQLILAGIYAYSKLEGTCDKVEDHEVWGRLYSYYFIDKSFNNDSSFRAAFKANTVAEDALLEIYNSIS